MNWKRVVSFVLLFTLCFCILIPSNTSAEPKNFVDPYSNLLPGALDAAGNAAFGSGGIGWGADENAPLHLRYPIFGYALTMTPIGGSAAGLLTSGGFIPIMNSLMSMAMQAMAAAALIVIGLMSWAFGYNGLDGLAGTVNGFVEVLTNKLFFGELTAVLLFFLGIALMFAFGRNEDVAGKLLKVIFNLILAFTILFNMGSILKFMDYIGEKGSTVVLTAFGTFNDSKKDYTKLTEGEKGKAVLLHVQEKFWEYNVYIPWQLAQFGAYAQQDSDKWGKGEKKELKQQIHNDSKKYLLAGKSGPEGFFREKVNTLVEQAKEIGNTAASIYNGAVGVVDFITPGDQSGAKVETSDWWGKSYITMTAFGFPFRLLIVFLTFVIGTAYGCLLLAISGAIIICQLFLYLLAIFGPFILLFTWLPETGDKVLLTYVQTFFAAAVYKIIAILLLVALLFVQGAIYDAADEWIYAIFAQIMLVFTVFLFRSKLADFIPLAGVAIFQSAEDQLYNKSKAAVDKTIDTVVDVGKTTLALGAAGAGAAVGMPGLAQPLKARGGILGNILGGAAEDAANNKRNSGPTGSRDENPGNNDGRRFGNPMPQGGQDGDDDGPQGNNGPPDPNGPRQGPFGGPGPQLPGGGAGDDDDGGNRGTVKPGQGGTGGALPGSGGGTGGTSPGQGGGGTGGGDSDGQSPAADGRRTAVPPGTVPMAPGVAPVMQAGQMMSAQGQNSDGGGTKVTNNYYNQATYNNQQTTTNTTNQSPTSAGSIGGVSSPMGSGLGGTDKTVKETIVRETQSSGGTTNQGGGSQHVNVSGNINITGPGGSSSSMPISGSGSGGNVNATGNASVSGGNRGGGSSGGGFVNNGSVGGSFTNTGMDTDKGGFKFIGPSVGSSGGSSGSSGSSSYDGEGPSDDEEKAIKKARRMLKDTGETTLEQNAAGVSGNISEKDED